MNTLHSEKLYNNVDEIRPENIIIEQKIRTHFTERYHTTNNASNLVWLKKGYIRIAKMDNSLRIFVSRTKESPIILIQAVLDGATMTSVQGSHDIYGNITLFCDLEKDPIYHHCHLQIKKKLGLIYGNLF